MALSLISRSHHVDFESFFDFDDAGMVQMFETLITTGFKNFLGCPAVFYEAALTEFFTNGSVRDGLVVSTLNGVTLEISEKVFAEAFELPIDGLTDLSDVPKNLVFDARSLFSASQEQVCISCLKKELKNEFHLLHDILAKTIFVKAGSFDAVTRERFMLMTAITFDVKVKWSNILFGVLKAMVTPGSRNANCFAIQIGVILQKVPGLELGDSRPFPASRVLTENTVHRFVNINEQVGMENTAASPRVKKTPVKKAVSKKRQVGAGEEAPVMKKKRTTKGKPAAIALEAVALKTIEPTADMPAEQPSKPKRKTQKRKRRLVLDDADETVDSAPEQPAAEIVAGAQVPIVDDPVATQPNIVPTVEATTDDPVAMFEKILNQLDTVAGTDGGDQPAAPATESTPWFDLPFMLARREAEGLLSSDTDEDLEQIFTELDTAGTTDGTVSIEQTLESVDETGPVTRTVSSKKVAEEHMSIDDLLLQISDDMLLPSVTAAEVTKIRLGESITIREVQEHDLYFASLPRISIHDKGKGILEEDEAVKGNPAREMVELICGDVEFLVRLRDRLKAKEKLMLEWAETDSLETAVKRKTYILAKYREMLLRKFVESHRKYYTPGQPWKATASKINDLLSVAHSKSLEDLIAQQKEHGLPIEQPCTSTFLDTSVDSGAALAQFYSMAKSTCWVRPLVLINGVWTPIQGTDFWRSSCKLSLFFNRKKLPETVIEDTFVPHGFFIEPVQYWGAAPALIRIWGWHRVCTDIIRDSDVESLAEIDLSSSDAPTVYRSPSPILQEADSFEHNLHFALGPAIFSGGAQEELSYFVESPESPSPISPCQESSSSSIDVSMHFDKDDILLDDNANVQPTLSDVPTDIFPLFDDLKTYLSQRMDTATSDLLSRLRTIERGIQDTLGQQNYYFRGLIQSARQDAQTQDNIHTLRFNEFRKNILAQNASIFTGLADVRKEVQEINAKVDIMATNLETVKKDVEATKEALSHQLLEFQAQAQENHNIIHAQLSELVAYINRVVITKRGKVAAAEDLNLHHLPLIKSEALVLMLVHQTLRRELIWHRGTYGESNGY
ncbi:hypothetical protein F511_42546 [Dorcoceras hygrometricum]|uniref:Dystroglycan-like n=1 Tax=Dorcoceras hygrometricum TaxID=472368 RepID=A0A2Z7AYE4_9LAMI|nr:hypothetical protein F511_42546 [Dorcoceras hygrometricum]